MVLITITIRQSNADKTNVEIDSESTVLALKEKIESILNVSSAQQRLIYKGKVLKNESTLEFYGVENEHTVHMVKGSAPGSSSTAASSSAPVQPNPVPANPFAAPAAPGGTGTNANPNTGLLGAMMNPNMAMNPQAMQQQLMQNPEMMAQLMNNPMMESLMSNPETLRNMMMSNPQMQAMMDQNPQIRHALNDPATLRQTMEMMRNPHAMQQAMRSQELMISQLENHPMGFNALRRMQEDVAEPMMEAANEARQGLSQSNPSATNPASQPTPSGAPNTSAIPNPWGANPTATPAANPGLGGFPPMGAGGMPSMPGVGGFPPMMDSNQMAALMNNPMMQQQMAAALNDPAMIQQMTAMNPQLGPMLNNPQFRAMLANPEFLRQMSNPANIQASMQMQQAMQQLQSSGLMPPMPGMAAGAPGGMFGMPAPAGASPASGGVGNLDFSALLGSTTTPGASTPFGGAPAATGTGNATAPAAPMQSLNERYASQLSQLQAMGFSDDERSLRVLQQCNGNVNAAVERLLSGS